MVNKHVSPLLQSMAHTLIILISLMGTVQAAEFTANVDRNEITENDTFSLFLHFDEQVALGQPDLSGLQKDFRILHQQRSNQFQSVNGKSISFTEWKLTLTPTRTGTGTDALTIPAIEFKGQKSQPIQMEVTEISASVKERRQQEFFFDINVDNNVSYVQAQILYTEKLYYAIHHENASLTELNVTDARTVPIGEVRQYNTRINGQQMGVYERRYAIFPEESGELTIPGQQFSANVINPNDRWSRGRPVSIVSKPIKIQINPTPASYPNAAWLPSTQVKISDQWSSPNNDWKIGEPMTRNININALGLSGIQIPNIELEQVDGLKYYPDRPEHEDQMSNMGISGSYQQSIAIVPTKSGPITLPEVRIPWWNLITDTLEYAILPEQTITVSETNLPTVIQSNKVVTSEREVGSPDPKKNTLNSSSNTSNVNSSIAPTLTSSHLAHIQSRYWILATLLLLVTNIVTAFFLWKKNQSYRLPNMDITADDSEPTLKYLKKACQNNDAAVIRKCLKQWSQAKYKTSRLDNLKSELNDVDVNNELDKLERYLYNNNALSADQESSQEAKKPEFKGMDLWRALNKARKQSEQISDTKNDVLKTLYPRRH